MTQDQHKIDSILPLLELKKLLRVYEDNMILGNLYYKSNNTLYTLLEAVNKEIIFEADKLYNSLDTREQKIIVEHFKNIL